MAHNKIQKICSGDEIDFAFGEVYGLRQWQMQTRYELHSGEPSLIGHYSSRWNLGTNYAVCKVSSDGCMTLALVPDECRGYAKPGDNPIEIAYMRVQKYLAARDIDIDKLYRLEINGGADGGRYRSYLNSAKMRVIEKTAGGLVYAGDRFKPRIRLDRIEANGNRVYVDLETGQSKIYNSISEYTDMRNRSNKDVPLFYEVDWKEDESCGSVAQPACQCGFYAYTDINSIIENSHPQPYSVFGLIKGHGKVTIGTKGFRAEKADIVALAAPVNYQYPSELDRKINSMYKTSGVDEPSKKLNWKYLKDSDVSLIALQHYVRGTSIQVLENPDQLLEFARVRYGLSAV